MKRDIQYSTIFQRDTTGCGYRSLLLSVVATGVQAGVMEIQPSQFSHIDDRYKNAAGNNALSKSYEGLKIRTGTKRDGTGKESARIPFIQFNVPTAGDTDPETGAEMTNLADVDNTDTARHPLRRCPLVQCKSGYAEGSTSRARVLPGMPAQKIPPTKSHSLGNRRNKNGSL